MSQTAVQVPPAPGGHGAARRICLVSWVKTELARAAPARDLYISDLFRKSRAWAERHADAWFILSAK